MGLKRKPLDKFSSTEGKTAEEILLQKPLFSSTEEYVNHSKRQMEVLASKYSLSIEKLIEHAESSNEDNSDFFKVIKYSKAIHSFQK